MPKTRGLKRSLKIGSVIIGFAAASLLFSAAPALADTAYFTYNSAETGNFVYALNDTVTETLLTDTITLTPLQTDYFRSPNASFYSKAFANGNAVASGTWNVYLWAYCLNPSKVLLSAEIGEFTSGGAYNVWISTANFGWTVELDGKQTQYTLTYADPSTHTMSAGSRVYIRVYAQSTHSTQNRDVYLLSNTTARNSRTTTAAFAKPIPTLGWWLLLVLIISFSFVAVRKGALKLKRIKS